MTFKTIISSKNKIKLIETFEIKFNIDLQKQKKNIVYFLYVCFFEFNIQTFAQNISNCPSFPCQNNGSCNEVFNGYACLCPAGYAGTYCEAFFPCLNESNAKQCRNGVCIQTSANSWKCHCSPGFNGPTCNNDINECLSNPCINGVFVMKDFLVLIVRTDLIPVRVIHVDRELAYH
ncbi:nidogen and EGF-like domain-containing 1 isoform X1 [Brachionus plicatilis]|uniref:Nidogen and EGF-like domain-containing 1 isoform X1 n=1 Tax=Brachionus plicatilis TaxID=10195 RepID=A0A3M7SJJ7_BRAPC|nr:nidogen and EGF-like domain-containing 1 isoform X1 [Brachionus plicatilis]